MYTAERLSELVRLGIEVRDLAEDLDLGLISLLADMVVVESRRAQYQSLDDEIPASNIIAGQWSFAPGRKETVSRRVRKRRLAKASNVTELVAYRAMRR